MIYKYLVPITALFIVAVFITLKLWGVQTTQGIMPLAMEGLGYALVPIIVGCLGLLWRKAPATGYAAVALSVFGFMLIGAG